MKIIDKYYGPYKCSVQKLDKAVSELKYILREEGAISIEDALSLFGIRVQLELMSDYIVNQNLDTGKVIIYCVEGDIVLTRYRKFDLDYFDIKTSTTDPYLVEISFPIHRIIGND